MYIESADNIMTINDNLAPPTKQCSQLIWDIFSHWVLYDEVTSLGLQLLTLSVVVLWGPILVLDSSVVYVCTLWCCVRWDHQTLYTDCVHNLYITNLVFKTLQRALQLSLLETQSDQKIFINFLTLGKNNVEFTERLLKLKIRNIARIYEFSWCAFFLTENR